MIAPLWERVWFSSRQFPAQAIRAFDGFRRTWNNELLFISHRRINAIGIGMARSMFDGERNVNDPYR